LIQLIALCCEGKCDIAEKKAKEFVLTFRQAVNIIYMAEDFWPLKIGILNYLTHAYMESKD